MKRFDAIFAGIFLGGWASAIFFLAWGPPGLDSFLPPRALFPFAAALGWFAGNLYMVRRRSTRLGRRLLLSIYLGGPPAILWLFWALAPTPVRAASPLAPLLAVTILGVFFLVPVTLRRA